MTRNLHDDFARLARERAADSALPVEVADAVVAAGGRRQRVRVASWSAGSVAAVAVGVLAVTNLGGALSADPAATSPSPSTDGTVVIDVADDSALSAAAVVPECGAAAPVPTGTVDGLTLTRRTDDPVALSPLPSDYPRAIAANVTSTRDDAPVVSIGPLAFVWVQDGAVVGFSHDPRADAFAGEYAFEAIAPGASPGASGTIRSETYRCDDDAEGPWTTLAEGDYEVYPVARVVASPEVAGWAQLSGDGALASPGNAPDPDLYAGSPVCELIREQVAEVSGEGAVHGGEPERVPAECDLSAEAAALGTATIDYPAEDYITDIDATLVAAPIAVTIEQNWTAVSIDPLVSDAGAVLGDSVQCGAQVEPPSRRSARALLWAVLPDGVALDGASLDVYFASSQVTGPTVVDLPPTFRVWMVEDDGETATVMGSYDVEVTGDTSLLLERNHGFVRTEGVVTGTQHCGEGTTYSYGVPEAVVIWTDATGQARLAAY